MKKNLLYSTVFKTCLLVAGLFFTGPIFAQSITITNGQTRNASAIPAATLITINSGGVLNMDVPRTYNNITTAGSGNFSISGASPLTVSNTITVTANAILSITPVVLAANLTTVALNDQTATLSGTGTLNAGAVTIHGVNGNNDATLVVGPGFTLQAGNIAEGSGNSATDHNLTTSGILRISGSLTGIDDLDCNDNSTVEYNGGNNQDVPGYNYYNLALAGTGAKTFSGDRTITGNFLLEHGVSLSLGNNDLTINTSSARTATINGRLNLNGNGRLLKLDPNSKTLTMGPNGYISLTGTYTVSNFPFPSVSMGHELPVFGTYVFDTNSTVEYGATEDQTIADVPSPGYGHLIVSGNSNNDTKEAAGGLDIQGNLTISGSEFDASNFTHNLRGNWIKDGGAFTTGSGRINFSGSSHQTIGGIQPTTFERIAFTNTSGGITLIKPTTVTADAIFTSGIVSTDATNLLIFNDNASSSLAATAGNTTSYVSGPVRKIGNDDFTFPVGKVGTGFVPIRIADISGAASTFTAEYTRATPPNRTSITAIGIDHISKCEYWVLDRAAGTAATPDVTAYWNPNSPCDAGTYVTQASSMRLVHYNGTQWNAASTLNGTGNPGAGSVTWSNVSSFSPFALGTTSSTENTLPVVFGDIKAYEKNGGVQVEWSNLTEKDVASYSIERSSGVNDFSAIGQQLPMSNQNDKVSYSAFDANPNTGANYYRIKATETTGKIVYSKVLSVSLGHANKRLTLYPNPVTGGHVTISLSGVKPGRYSLRIVNIGGQDIHKQIVNNQGSTMTQAIDLPSITPGVYSMIITGDNYRELKTFIVQ
jgi:hypothetical protein